MSYEALKQRIQEARDRGEGREVARLRFTLPLSERAEFITSDSRGYRGTAALGRPGARVAPSRAPGNQAGSAVLLDRSVRQRLDGIFDGAEVGAYLVGPVTDGADIVVTGTIAESGDDCLRTRTSTELDRPRAIALWETLDADQTLLGDVHCHPPETTTQPSPTDLRSWENNADIFGKQWLGVICRNVPTWSTAIGGRAVETDRLEIVATLVRREGSGFTHREITIEEGY